MVIRLLIPVIRLHLLHKGEKDMTNKEKLMEVLYNAEETRDTVEFVMMNEDATIHMEFIPDVYEDDNINITNGEDDGAEIYFFFSADSDIKYFNDNQFLVILKNGAIEINY